MTRETHHLFPNTLFTAPLETWTAAIQRLSFQAKRCVLEKVVHYKALSGKEHEFLVVYASHPSGSKIVLGVDRNAQNSTRALRTLVNIKSPLSSSEKESSDLAYDRVQVSHDGTPAPILAQHGPHVPLYTFALSPTSASSSEDVRFPSLLQFSILLLTIRERFPSYVLLEYQCYFFARATCLALVDIFGDEETELEVGRRAATWRGVHVSVYSAGCTTLQESLTAVASQPKEKMLAMVGCAALETSNLAPAVLAKMHLAPAVLGKTLPLVAPPWLAVPVGLFAMYRAARLYNKNVAEGVVERRRIR